MATGSLHAPPPMNPPVTLVGGSENPAQLLYFTSPSVTADGRELVFLRKTGDNPNLFALDLVHGGERQLTFNREGTLQSYVYFRGRPHQGFGKASVSLDPRRGIAYFLQGDEICSVNRHGEIRRLNRIPAGQMTAFTHVSTDGRRLCVPTVDERAFAEESTADSGTNLVGGKRNEVIREKPAHDIDERVRREQLSSWLRVYDTADGREILCERVPQAWITHVQFSPVNPNWILYNHEWPADCGIRRLWLWDGATHRRLRSEGDDRHREDWTCHEMWEPDGAGIIYHGKFRDGTAFIGRVSPAGGDNVEIPLPAEYHRYGHFTAGTRRNDLLVSDGYWHPAGEPENEGWGGEWITLQRIDWARRTIAWIPLCRHHSLWDCQDSHPHPIFGPDEKSVYFTSNAGGGRSICRVDLPAKLA